MADATQLGDMQKQLAELLTQIKVAAQPVGYYDQFEVSITARCSSVALQNYFDVVEAMYVDPKYKGVWFKLVHRGFALDGVEAESDGRLRFFGGNNMNFPAHVCDDIRIEGGGVGMQYRVVGYKLPPRTACLNVTEERVLPVIAHKRRNLLVVNKGGECGNLQLMYVHSCGNSGTVLPGMGDVTDARMHPLVLEK